MTKNLDLIDYILPELVARMNNPDSNYDINDAALVHGVCAALKVDPTVVWSRIKAHCHRHVAMQ